MPEYIYRCKDCAEFRSVTHGISEDPVIRCKECNIQMQRRPMTVAVAFKGEGWAHKEKKNG